MTNLKLILYTLFVLVSFNKTNAQQETSLKVHKNTMKTTFKHIINASELFELVHSNQVILINAGGGPNGRSDYEKQHLNGAFFLDLNEDLSEIHEDPAHGGRHPLPKIEDFAQTISNLGMTPDSHVVVYDNKGGANASARLWWMLKAIGHENVQVLNGGIQEAKNAQFPINSDKVTPKVAPLYPVTTWLLPRVNMDHVENVSQNKDYMVIDVRATPRYNGEFEPIDSIAGHIPGTVNVPFSDNLEDNGTFKSPEVLKEKYTQIFKNTPRDNIIFHCGSGVTACHSLLAIAHAGLDIPKLYVGSWSEWSRNNKAVKTEN